MDKIKYILAYLLFAPSFFAALLLIVVYAINTAVLFPIAAYNGGLIASAKLYIGNIKALIHDLFRIL